MKSTSTKKQTKTNRIDVKEAAKAAAEYFVELYPDSQYSDLMLEEVELSEDEKHWLITLSYASEPPPPPPSGLEQLFSKKASRKYKLFKIDAATGAKGHYLVLTRDAPLVGCLENLGIDVINFNHLKTIGFEA